MKIVSWNVRGLRSLQRRVVVKQVIGQQKASVVLIQESKISLGEEIVAKDIWAEKLIKWVNSKAVGSLGGIFLLWDIRHIVP